MLIPEHKRIMIPHLHQKKYCSPDLPTAARHNHQLLALTNKPKDHLLGGRWGTWSVPHTQWHFPLCFISLAVRSVKQIITSEGLCSWEDLLLCCLPCRENGKILLMFTASMNVYALGRCVSMLGAVGGHVMCTSNAWGLTSIAKQLPGLFTISECADFRGFGVQMFCGCVCRSTCVVRCVMPGAATMMSAFTPLTLINPESSRFWSQCSLWYSVSCSAETDQWGESSIITELTEL